MSNIVEINTPGPFINLAQTPNNLLETFMTRLRSEETKKADFNPLAILKVAPILAYEATRNLTVSFARVKTPTSATYDGAEIGDHKQLLVTIPRAAEALYPAFNMLLPEADYGYINMRRDEETTEAVVGDIKLPEDCQDFSDIFVLDPMLATGGSMARAANILIDLGAKPNRITTVSVLAAPAGVLAVHAVSPEITVITAALDPTLNDKGYIVPGLGDFGDRTFGSATSGVPLRVQG